MPGLFDNSERTNATPALYAEDTFSFLNRAAGPVWERIRTTLDTWYARCSDDTGDLRRRFRSRDHRQHYAAWWELYIHELFTALGFSLTAHPELDDSSGRPDFLAVRGEERLYIEAVTTFSGIVAAGMRNVRLQNELLDVINTVDATNFFVNVNIEQIGDERPPNQAVTTPIAAWLGQLDPDDVLRARVEDYPVTTISPGSWRIRLQVIPRGAEHRGKQDNRLVGLHGAIVGFTNDRQQLVRALDRKKKRYGTPDCPLIIAVLAASSLVDDRVVAEALFGSHAVQMNAAGMMRIIRQPDGFWIGKRGVSAKKVSGVLVGAGLSAETCARNAPQLWRHFEPVHELSIELPFASVRVENGELRPSAATKSPSEILALPADWPGPERPFGI